MSPRRLMKGGAIPLGLILASTLATTLVMIVAARPAEAYVRTRHALGTRAAWAGRRLILAVTEADAQAAPALVPALRAAAATWGGDRVPCTDLSISVEVRATDDVPPARADDTTWIVLRGEVRCGDPLRQTFCLQPESLALTTIFARIAPGCSVGLFARGSRDSSYLLAVVIAALLAGTRRRRSNA